MIVYILMCDAALSNLITSHTQKPQYGSLMFTPQAAKSERLKIERGREGEREREGGRGRERERERGREREREEREREREGERGRVGEGEQTRSASMDPPLSEVT